MTCVSCVTGVSPLVLTKSPEVRMATLLMRKPARRSSPARLGPPTHVRGARGRGLTHRLRRVPTAVPRQAAGAPLATRPRHCLRPWLAGKCPLPQGTPTAQSRMTCGDVTQEDGRWVPRDPRGDLGGEMEFRA